jgi:protoheme IX farnesyltransferase
MAMVQSTYADVSGEARDFLTLLKPRVMFLVVFTGVAGMVVAPGHINIVLALIATLCIALASGGAGAINMWFDRDIDAIMTRTAERPIPMGRIEPEAALAFGGMAIFAAVSTMGLALNWTAAALLAGASAFYIFVYTMWLKRRTPQNIVIGGAAGAFPPVIGWAAVTGHADWQPWLLFLLVFLWTPPHFWALALYKRDDYARANIPMLPVVAGERATKIQMLLYTLLLIPVSLTPYFAHIAGVFYFGGAAVLGALFLLCCIRVMAAADHKPAKQMFAFSILYLFLIFACLIANPIR